MRKTINNIASQRKKERVKTENLTDDLIAQLGAEQSPPSQSQHRQENVYFLF